MDNVVSPRLHSFAVPCAGTVREVHRRFQAVPSEPNQPTVSAEMARKKMEVHDMKTEPIQIQAAKDAVCRVFDLQPGDMTSRRRPIRIAWPRQIAMVMAYQKSRATLVTVSAAFRKDRGTVTYAVRRVFDLVTPGVDENSRRQWEQCMVEFERIINGTAELERLGQSCDIAVATTG